MKHKENLTRQFKVLVTERLGRQLDREAHKLGISTSAYMRMLINHALENDIQFRDLKRRAG